MNHNFVDWKITKMLPKINPYQSSDLRELRYCQYEDAIYHCRYNSKDKNWQDAFTWENIRLYLESKGYIITVFPYVDDCSNINEEPKYQLLYYYKVLFTSTLEEQDDFTYYHSFEEARKESILYVLNLINIEKH